ncbi:MAG: shikimate kinase [Acidobacteriaceae bacterium]
MLTGFMGAGKSTVGPLLAQQLDWEFADADDAIELRAGKKVPQIFAQDGEAAFRAIEAEAIRDCCRRENLVLALGGGALETGSTRELLAGLEATCVVFLDAPLGVLVERCLAQTNAAERPVLADREKLLGRFKGRLAHYRNADVTIATADLSPAEVVDRILSEIRMPSCK